MAEILEPGVLETPKPRRKIKVTDIIAFAVLAVIIVALAVTLLHKLSIKNDSSAAQKISDQAIADLQKRDGTAARKLGSATFQKTYSADQLTAQFKAVEIATLKPPALDRTTVFDSKTGRTVYFIYKYTALKVPYYVRTAINRHSGHWQLTNISGSANESNLVIE